MQLFKFHITGISPLLMNNPASMEITSNQMRTQKGISPEDEIAKAPKKLYRWKDGTLYLPAVQFRMALLYAVGNKKVGRRSARSVISASVFCTEERCQLLNAENKKPLTDKDYEVDVRRIVNKTTKGSNLRARPMIRDWSLIVEFQIDTDLVSPEIVAENLNEAGKLSGCGDFRPQKMGPFGRFDAKLIK